MLSEQTLHLKIKIFFIPPRSSEPTVLDRSVDRHLIISMNSWQGRPVFVFAVSIQEPLIDTHGCLIFLNSSTRQDGVRYCLHPLKRNMLQYISLFEKENHITETEENPHSRTIDRTVKKVLCLFLCIFTRVNVKRLATL